jgi:hypothetical protein
VYHFKVPEEARGNGHAKNAIRHLISTAEGDSDITRILMTVGCPDSETEDILRHLFSEFNFDDVRGPYTPNNRETGVLEANKLI